MEQDKKADIRKTEKDSSDQKINSVTELISFCLKSKSFDLLLAVMIGFVWCGIILLRDIVSGRDSTESLIVLYVWPILISVFSLAVFSYMIHITQKIKKGISTIIFFALIVVLIPILMIIVL